MLKIVQHLECFKSLMYTVFSFRKKGIQGFRQDVVVFSTTMQKPCHNNLVSHLNVYCVICQVFRDDISKPLQMGRASSVELAAV